MSYELLVESSSTPLDSPQYIELKTASVCFCNMAHPERKEQSQDAICILSDDASEEIIFAIADGAGGHRNPAAASSNLLHQISQDLIHEKDNLEKTIEAIERANEFLRKNYNQSHSTLILGLYQKKTLRSLHVGDSKLVIFGGRGKLKFETIGHNLQEICTDSGLDSYVQNVHDVPGHIVTNLLGANRFKMEISNRIDIAPQDTIIIGSDGLFDNISMEELASLSSELDLRTLAIQIHEKVQSRIYESLENSEIYRPDDMSFIICRFHHETC